ncbi:coadhesin-like [Hydractinia symbiolongicarpus]|uniref:coadhesin-like n=1 Tax=Hydractinia symbiolongicarpus TaxID=13093 RepID=UPI00254B108F|nr:coadhesin-like [Hydractinia symbiolongicarpus]
MVCPVNGGWGPWHNLTECSVTCGKGYYHQKRLCNNPAPKGKGEECQLVTTDEYGLCENRTLACNCQPCPVIGLWSTWNSWSECSVTCDLGQTRRNRTCNNTLGLYGNVECLLSDNITLTTYETQTRDCGGNSCPIHGEWGSWTTTECSTSCGNGTLNRSRKCNDPEPQFKGRNCLKTDNTSSLKEFTTTPCNLRPCPIHGEWGSWTTTECSTSCGNGALNRSRKCNDPEPQFGGRNCLKIDNTSSLEEFVTTPCNLRPCPIHGEWGAWSSWTTCDKTCDQGLRQRNRTCDYPSPQFGGMECLLKNGTRDQEENVFVACNEMVCPVNGKWGLWKNVTGCSSTCGGGFYTQERVCDSPAPVGLGNPCEFITYDGYGLLENRTFACNTQLCPVHGGWSSWESWSSCSKSCDIGFKRRNRSCNSPEPLFGGKECLLNNTVGTGLSESHTRECRLRDCPIDGEWGSWTNTPCSVTCGGGELKRTRQCNNPPPQFGGMCVTNNDDRMFNESLTESCNNELCPVNGSWAAWSTWTSCSLTCGTGVRHRNRLCNNPLPVTTGLECLKKD